MYLLGLIPQIISAFTLQVDMAKKIKCDQLHTLVNQLIMLGANLATTVLGGLLGPEMAGLSLEVRTAMTELEDINKRLIWDDLVEKGEYIKIGHRIADLRKIVQKGKEKLGKPIGWPPLCPLILGSKKRKPFAPFSGVNLLCSTLDSLDPPSITA